jgi:hypothetical protein
MKLVLFIGIALYLLSLCNVFAEEITASGLQIRASCVAFNSFIKEYPNYNLSKYNIYINKLDDNYEIIFAPMLEKKEMAPRGGENIYGKEIHYIINGKTFEITRVFFAK